MRPFEPAAHLIDGVTVVKARQVGEQTLDLGADLLWIGVHNRDHAIRSVR